MFCCLLKGDEKKMRRITSNHKDNVIHNLSSKLLQKTLCDHYLKILGMELNYSSKSDLERFNKLLCDYIFVLYCKEKRVTFICV